MSFLNSALNTSRKSLTVSTSAGTTGNPMKLLCLRKVVEMRIAVALCCRGWCVTGAGSDVWTADTIGLGVGAVVGQFT